MSHPEHTPAKDTSRADTSRARLKDKPLVSFMPYHHRTQDREQINLESGLMLSSEIGDAEVFG